MNAKGQRPTAVETWSNYKALYAYDSNSNVEYIGKADIGTASSAASWQIKKFVYSGTNLTQILFADGNDAFDNIWDNRASLSYS